MENIETLQRKIETAEKLQSIVETMKAYASFNINQFQGAAKASMAYKEILDKAVYVILSKENISFKKGKSQKNLHIIFGTDHGMVGKFNEKIMGFALKEIEAGQDDILMVIGQLLLSKFENKSQIYYDFFLPQSQNSIINSVQELLLKIEEIKEKYLIDKIILYYNEPTGTEFFKEKREMLFPLDFQEIRKNKIEWNSRSVPTYYVDRENLIEDLIQQYFFITLYHAFCHSLASENSSRLSAMESAEKNIRDRIEDLDFNYKSQRQSGITDEINEIIAGFKAIKKGDNT